MKRNILTLFVIATGAALTLGACASDKSTQKDQDDQATSESAQTTDKKKKGAKSKAAKQKKMMKKMMKADKSKMPSDKNVKARVTQEKGKVSYWVLPGPRELDSYFGTKENPKMTAEVPEGAPPPIKQLIKDFPILIGVPEKARTYKDGKAFTKMPTAFGDKGVPVKNSSLDLTYIDRQSTDGDGPAIKTADEIKGSIKFTDPKGNNYELVPMLAFQPPIPGYKTQGGVLTDGTHHGTTGTGSPLMPEVYTWGAFWAIGNVKINGEVADKKKVMHCMTTETVRNTNYELSLSDELPLPKGETIAGQRHHTHCIVLPITITPNGPKHEPVTTAFELPNGKNQPFIHIMYENDKLQEGPDWNGPSGNGGN